MRRALSVAVLVGLIASGFARSARASDELLAGMSPLLALRTSPSRADYVDGRLIGETLVDLRRTSPTFRDVLATLTASPRLVTLVSPSREIQQVLGLIGRTRFQAGPDRVVAFIDVHVDLMAVGIRREAIAHELAHVAEVACLGDFFNQADLRAALSRHVHRRPDVRDRVPIETGFAVDVGRQVLQESRSDGRLTSQPPTAVVSSASARRWLCAG